MTLANTVNRSNSVPAAPAGNQNVIWQDDGGSPIVNVSAYVPIGAGLGTPFSEVVSFSGTTGTLSHTPASDATLLLFRNGVYQRNIGGTIGGIVQDYSISTATITLAVAAGGSDVFVAVYWY